MTRFIRLILITTLLFSQICQATLGDHDGPAKTYRPSHGGYPSTARVAPRSATPEPKQSSRKPTVVLVGNVAEGVGDLVHLEEYMKYLKYRFPGEIDSIAVCHLGREIDEVRPYKHEAISRADRLSSQYESLKIRVSKQTGVFSDVQLMNSLLSNEEKAAVTKKIVVSFNGDLAEYGMGGPFRFYQRPGKPNPDSKLEFMQQLQIESPDLYRILIDNERTKRSFTPGDFKFKNAMVAFFRYFNFKEASDFYLPKKLLSEEETRLKIHAIADGTGKKVVFITSENVNEAASHPADETTIRIFYGFPLSDNVYKGLYLYTQGDVVGYAGDDTFSLALSSGKLPFSYPNNGVQENLLRLLSTQIRDEALKAYFLKMYEFRLLRQRSALRGDDTQDLEFEHLPRNEIELRHLKEAWLRFSTEAFESDIKNGFRRLDAMIWPLLTPSKMKNHSD